MRGVGVVTLANHADSRGRLAVVDDEPGLPFEVRRVGAARHGRAAMIPAAARGPRFERFRSEIDAAIGAVVAFGHQYGSRAERLREQWERFEQDAIDVGAAGLDHDETHPAPRWWRPAGEP